MKAKIVLSIAIAITFLACNKDDDFSIDQCVGDYVCEEYGAVFVTSPPTDRLAPGFSTVHSSGNIISVDKVAGTNQIAITIKHLNDRTILADVDNKGNLTISPATKAEPDGYYTISVTTAYTGHINSKELLIEETGTGTAIYNDSKETFSVPVQTLWKYSGTKK